ncbi:hypothetical protein RHGRI_000390 [Rhododendron griersonianum]|uniref:Ubiquitin-like protease family profile domain-containing protein n=1 Tax=Rhododendron griersonianum TaxID=479676 RepID=A0AAV6LHI5_9ERIC|nr:hypothetical protein RHGRI_000390 [Rhododendron griersonianum]
MIAEEKTSRVSPNGRSKRRRVSTYQTIINSDVYMNLEVSSGSMLDEKRHHCVFFEKYWFIGFVTLRKDFTRGLKKSFKEDNIIKQPEVMGAMSKWWHCGYLRKNYDETYQGSSSDEGNGEEEVNDEDWSEEEDICLPRPTKKKKKSKGERKKKKVPVRVTNKSGGKAERVGGSLFLLMVIYFDLNPLDVEVGNELDPPIGSWTKEFIDVRISKEMEDMPIEDSVFSQFPPHNLKNQICIDMYKEHMRQFMKNSKFLHEMDASMGEPVVGSPVVGSPEDGQRAEPVQDEGHSPQFSPNFELYEYGQQDEGEGEGDQIQEKGEGEEEEEEDGDQIKETRDEIEEEGEVGGQKSYMGRRPLSESRKSEVLIRIEGAKWPLTRKEVGESFRPRGLVCNMVMYTFTEWRMMKERAVATNGRPSRHIFAPAFASNLLATKSDEFSTVLRDDCDPDKLGYDLLKCDMLFLPVLESDHWFCVCISLVESRVYILDSMKGKEENVEQLEQVGSIQQNLFALLKKRPTRRSRNDSHIFTSHYAVVPQQTNIHDCGIYVMKFLDRWDGRTYPSGELQGGHIPKIRKRLLLHLFMDEKNKERDSILKAIPRR